MVKKFTEFKTDAYLAVGDESLLSTFTSAAQVGYFTFIWTQEKEASLSVDGLPITLPAWSILALTPIQTIAIRDLSGARIYQFNREFYCIKDHDKEVGCVGLLFFGNKQIPVVQLNERERDKFALLHDVFLDEMEEPADTIQAEMLQTLMARFIIKTTRLLKASDHQLPPQEGKLELLRKFNLLVETHFREEHSVGFYAGKLFKSPKTLSNSFGKFSMSPLKIIHERIVLEAKRALMYTEKTAKEIAFELGFEDPSHLTRVFKKQCGLSPSQFKAQYKSA
ncbi:MAG: AraC family transcriptional regulator [Bacteroidota bacterium]